jgi:hypothetical protein
MVFSAGDAIEVIVALNPFAPRLDSRSIIPSHNEWAADNSFNPFGVKPVVPISYPKPGIPLRRPTRGGLRIEEGLNVGYGVNRGHGFMEVNMTRRNTQEVRFGPLLDCGGPKTNRVYRRDPDSRPHKCGLNAASIGA